MEKKSFRSPTPWAWIPTLYFAEGLPYVMVTFVSIVMFKQLGLSNADITWYTSWISLPWVIKPLWSPFVDIIKTKRWWITTMQLLIGAAFGGVAFTIPTTFWLQGTLFCFWAIAFASATHDIAADGFYMLGLSQHDQAWFVGIRSTFYRLANIFGQGVLVMLAGYLQTYYTTISYSWTLIFYGLAGLFIGIWLWHNFIMPRPAEDNQRHDVSLAAIGREMGHSIVTFFQKEQVLAGLLFMLFYRMPEGLLSKVSALFLIDAPHNGGLGLTPQDYGFVQGTVGVIGLTVGGILGGMAVGKHGLKYWLWPMVMALTLPDLVYVFLSFQLPPVPESIMLVNACVFVEQFGYGFGFTAYMLYLVYYSRGDYKTSHYALCTTFMALSLFIPGLWAGALQEAVGYKMFFIIVCAFCSVTYVVTAMLKVDPDFGKQQSEKQHEEHPAELSD